MPRTARVYSASGFYHIVMRGIGKQILFEDKSDYLRFLSILRKYIREENFKVHAYCLMENHFHLLIHAETGLDRIMKRIATSYAYYFNEKYSRCGHLFQDRFNSEPINDEKYLLAVVRYIHNNPQKAGICSREEYGWSSYQAYISNKPDFVSTDLVLELTGGIAGFKEFSESKDETECLDIKSRSRKSDREAQDLIRTLLNLESGTQLQNMNRENRNVAIRKLKEKGLSIKQIERLTGINRGVIQKA